MPFNYTCIYDNEVTFGKPLRMRMVAKETNHSLGVETFSFRDGRDAGG